MKQKNIWLATLVAIASIAGAQSNEGPTIFTGATTSPDAVVSINQTGDGNLINGTTKSGALVLTVDPSGAVGSVGPGAGVAGWDTSTNVTFPLAGVQGIVSNGNGSTGLEGVALTQGGIAYGVTAFVQSPFATAARIINKSDTGGNLLVGIVGSANRKVFRVNNNGRGFFDGGTRVGGADFAESIAIVGKRSAYSPGDVLIIDRSGERRLTQCQTPYSTLVAGIVSTKPGVLAAPFGSAEPSASSRKQGQQVPLAVVGIVPTRVTDENGPIEAGDLLVTSSEAGRAMKGTDRTRMMGAVVGKALQPLRSGKGVIEILVTLQ